MLNWGYLNEVTGGDTEFIAELFTEFLGSVPQLLTQMEEAIRQGNSERLRHSAHTLKGSARSIGAESFAELAYALEQIAKSGQLQKAPDALRQLTEQWSQLQHHLQSWLQQPSSPAA